MTLITHFSYTVQKSQNDYRAKILNMHTLEPIRIAGVAFASPLMNGAYVGSKTVDDVEALASSRAGGIIVGSISVLPRGANPGHGY